VRDEDRSVGLLREPAGLEREGSAADHDGFTNEHGFCALWLALGRGPLRAATTPGARAALLPRSLRAMEIARTKRRRRRDAAPGMLRVVPAVPGYVVRVLSRAFRTPLPPISAGSAEQTSTPPRALVVWRAT